MVATGAKDVARMCYRLPPCLLGCNHRLRRGYMTLTHASNRMSATVLVLDVCFQAAATGVTDGILVNER